MALLPRSCERARNWVSLDLDDELSELENAMLRAHTARCAPCAAFQADAAAMTSCLRLAPLEPMPAPVVLPMRRRSVSRIAQVGAAAAVAVVAAGIGTMLSTSQSAATSAPVQRPTEAQLMVAYLDAPQGLPQRAPIAFRPRIGLDPGPSNV
jgi:ferric-dicitrate binding protein FerR (iron transport regulator)